MTEGDLERFSRELLTIAAVFYPERKEPAPEAVVVYFEALKHLPLESVLFAFQRHVKTPGVCKFFPKPGDIEEAINGSRASMALEGWSKVDEAVRSHGRYRSVVFDDAAIHIVLRQMGGWVALCDVESEKDLAFKKQEFCRRYEGLGSRDRFPAVLLGVFDTSALAKGERLSRPVVVGDRSGAMTVFKNGERVGSESASYLEAPAIHASQLSGSTTTGKVQEGAQLQLVQHSAHG